MANDQLMSVPVKSLGRRRGGRGHLLDGLLQTKG